MKKNNKLLFNSVNSYFNNDDSINKLIDIIKNKKLSIRIIDWFVSNYSKKIGSQYIIYKDSNGKLTLNVTDNIYKHINVHHSYKCQLKSFSKKYFDPFCRRSRIDFKYNDKNIKSTLGQLNFFKWAFDNLITEYILINYQSIENDMNLSFSNVKKQKKLNIRKKRQELSKSASRGLLKYNSPIKVDFD